MKHSILAALISFIVILSSQIARADIVSDKCTAGDIADVCASVSDIDSAKDCYKGSYGYAGTSCETECKEKLRFCIDTKKYTLSRIFSGQ